jgi:hypothetical protein
MSEQKNSQCNPPLVHCLPEPRFECECGAERHDQVLAEMIFALTVGKSNASASRGSASCSCMFRGATVRQEVASNRSGNRTHLCARWRQTVGSNSSADRRADDVLVDRVMYRPVPWQPQRTQIKPRGFWSSHLDSSIEFPERLICMSVFDARVNLRDRIASVDDPSATRGSSVV